LNDSAEREAVREVDVSLETLRARLGSPDLAAWPRRAEDETSIDEARAALERRFTLAVVGEFSSGKSFLLNAMLEKTRLDGERVEGLLAVDINPSTATITELSYGAEERAVAVYPSGREERVPLDRLARFVAVETGEIGRLHDATADPLGAEEATPAFVRITANSAFLRGGFVVADTPGLASLNPAHRRATLGYLPRVDAVLYLIDTQQPFTEGDARFLGLIGEYVRTIFIVQTKIDLWRAPEPNGRPAWENARDRIVARAREHAPDAEVLAVSARDHAVGVMTGDVAQRSAGGVPALVAALERRLDARVRAARAARGAELGERLAGEARARIAAELVPLRSADPTQAAAAARRILADRRTRLESEAAALRRTAEERRRLVRAQGEAFAARLAAALETAMDVSDVERLRDRAKLRVLVDDVAGRALAPFARELAADVARELEAASRAHPAVRAVDVAARRFDAEPGVGAWSRDLASALRSAIVLGALGGPTLAFVQAVGAAFADAPAGTYMKRELRADGRARFFPALSLDAGRFMTDLAARIARAYGDVVAVIERELLDAENDALGPFERAREIDGLAAREARARQLDALDDSLAASERAFVACAAAIRPQSAHEPSVTTADGAATHASFDTETYDRNLRPERYRVVVVGALRRGKSALVNAIAGTAVLRDGGEREARFPIHVRYGERARAYALADDGWAEIAAESAPDRAADAPVLIETPWNLPRELVLVHAPAFDSGDAEAEAVALAAASRGTETLALFSRQLSDRELAFYARVAATGATPTFVHTLADHESAHDRRVVVDLAARYLRERAITVQRIFAVSAQEFAEACAAERAPAGWNELGALRETLIGRAEAHMERLRSAARAESDAARISAPSARAHDRGFFRRLFGRE